MGFLHDALVDIVLTTPLVGATILFALGIVFIYRASRILNLAHGAMAMVPAYIFVSVSHHAGRFVALAAALGFGAALGLLMDRTVVRRLRSSSSLAQTVGTVGVLGLLLALAVEFWGTAPTEAKSLFPNHVFTLGFSRLTLGDLGLFVIALALSGVFLALFRFTDLGLAMTCAADNRTAARLMGIDPDRTTAVAWIFAGMLAALGGVLLGASNYFDPYRLALDVLPAFVVALLAGMDSMIGVVVGSVVVGLVLGIVPTLGSFGQVTGAPEVAIGVLAFAVMAMRGRRYALADSGGAL